MFRGSLDEMFSFTLHNKITIIFSIIIAVILSGVFFALNSLLQEQSYQDIEAELLKQTELARVLVEEKAAEKLSHAEWDRLADQIGEALDLRATIVDADGVVVGDSMLAAGELPGVENHLERPEIREAFASGRGVKSRFSSTVDQDMLYGARMFDNAGKPGIIRLAIPLERIEHFSFHLKNILRISFLLAMALLIPASFVVAKYISAPLNQMAATAKRYADGNFSRRIHIYSRDAVGDLASALNHMAEQIRARIAEAALEKSRLEAVFLSMVEGVLVVDQAGSVVLMNQALRRLLSIKSDPIGKNSIEIIRTAEVQQMIDSSLSHSSGIQEVEISVRLPNEKTLLVHAAPIKRKDAVDGAVLVFHDISELRRLERMREEFVANVSHELRTPIASIKGYTETLLEGALGDKDNARDFLKIIDTDADRLASLIEDILSLSKIESGTLRMEFRPLALKPVVERVAQNFRKQISEKKIAFKNDISPDLPRVLADEDRIFQVFLNLIDNAVKYTPPGGEIAVSGKREGERVVVSVRDTGIGIPAEDLPRVFERFYRVDKARSREQGGTGLGLSIVKHIVQAHKGSVAVESAPEKGSTFSFSLPAA